MPHTADLRNIPGDTLVIHYGGKLREVDAYTFANSLVELAEAIQELNDSVNPDYKLTVSVDALGGGSFRAKLKMAPRITATLFKKVWQPVILPLLLMVFYDKFIATEEGIHIEISEEFVMITRGEQTIIVQREVFEMRNQIRNRASVDKHISSAFRVLEEDPHNGIWDNSTPRR